MLERTQILICGGTGCLSSKSQKIKEEFEKHLTDLGILEEVGITLTGCFGLCEKGPIVIVYPDETFYAKVKVENVEQICTEHIYKGKIVRNIVFQETIDGDIIKGFNEIGFYKSQKRIALRNCGVINPLDIEEYIVRDGYLALGKVLLEGTSKDVIKLLKASGLRGRGGGGFPTGKKWEAAAKEQGEEKFVLCNADEGDPGAFMDRAILEGDPHSVIEAMVICGYAIGASQGYFYIRAEYPIAVKRVEKAIEQAYEKGLLGKNIFGSDFNFDLDVRLGAGAFVCGEETALIASIEGERGMPRNKPPFPSSKGLFQKPTIINNVETLANIPIIVNKGADWFTSIGTSDSPGTKVFALGGKVTNTGLIEVPMGTTVREVIYDIGGGILNGKKFKAVQTGGPSGGVIPAKHLDTPIEYHTLKEIGTMMGSGGMIVLDETDCIVDIAKFYLDFTCEESCGKCTPCRIGTKRLLEILEKISSGNGTKDDLVMLKNLGETIKETSLCGLGKSAPNPILSTLNYFYDEYLAHVEDKKCPAGVCQDMLEIFITDKCVGCTKCSKVCPVDCIDGDIKMMHVINQNECIKCSTCIEACPVSAIVKR
ncbi:MAG: NADH-ubiquinone oxidoreductase-F iron-sulfur binding region domain-containing protein [Bacilli bacterium]